MGKADDTAVDALRRVVYNQHRKYDKDQQTEAIRSLGPYLHNEKATSFLNSVIYDTSKYPNDLRNLAIKVLGRR